jgi:MFS family permease
LIVLARLLQGLATGGEFSIASSLLMTLAPENKKGLYTSLQMIGQIFAVLFGSSLCFVLTLYFSTESLYQYAWRIPFAIGLLILPIGWILRQQLHKQFNWRKEPAPLKTFYPLIWQQKKNLLIAMGIVCGCTGSGYTLFSYMPTFAKVYLHLSLSESFFGPMAGVATALLLIPFFGALSDKIGKKPILVGALSIYIVLIYPLLTMLDQQPSLTALITVEIILGLFIGAHFGVLTAIVSEMFPEEIRSTCLAISYNSAVMLFGGFAPFIITALVEHTQNTMVFAYYLLFTVSISLIAAIFYQENHQHN